MATSLYNPEKIQMQPRMRGVDVNYPAPLPDYSGLDLLPRQAAPHKGFGFQEPTAPIDYSFLDVPGSVQTSGTTAGASTGNPWIAGAGVAADVIGTGFSIYQGMEQADQAEKEYGQALKQYEEQKRRAEEIDKYNREQQRLANTMAFGNYANTLRQQDSQTGDFYSSIGQ